MRASAINSNKLLRPAPTICGTFCITSFSIVFSVSVSPSESLSLACILSVALFVWHRHSKLESVRHVEMQCTQHDVFEFIFLFVFNEIAHLVSASRTAARTAAKTANLDAFGSSSI